MKKKTEIELLQDVVTDLNSALSSLEKTDKDCSQEIDRAIASLKAATAEMKQSNDFQRKKHNTKA